VIHQYDVVELRHPVGEWPAGTPARVVALGPGYVALRRRGELDDLMATPADVALIRRGDRPTRRPVLRSAA
jgi:hypothetical protein